MRIKALATAFVCGAGLSACGLYTPTKNIALNDTPDAQGISLQGEYERHIFTHVTCELATGMYLARARFKLPWVERWGTAVTLIISAQDQGGFSPGIALRDPIRNFSRQHATGGAVTIPQVISTSIGGAISTTATRAETVQVTWRNIDLLEYGADIINKTPKGERPCIRDGLQIDGDLKLSEFVFDKLQIAYSGDLNPALLSRPDTNKWPVYNTLTDELIFLSAFGGNITPSVSLAHLTADTSTTLLAAQRTYTNDLILTIGEIAKQPTPTTATSLAPAAQNQHNAKVSASAIATAIRSLGL